MENEIKQLYNALTGGKEITGDDFLLSKKHFSSITRDRFIAEIKKHGINWDGGDILFGTLLQGAAAPANSAGELRPQRKSISSSGRTGGPSVGIDIQLISELPECRDYWEDAFYKSKFKNGEIGYCLNKEKPAESFAGVYACKEALIKCDDQLHWDDIEITYSKEGKPGFGNYSLSISHSGGMAVAVAIKNELAEATGGSLSHKAGIVEQQGKDIKNIRSISIILFLLVLAILGYIIIEDFIS